MSPLLQSLVLDIYRLLVWALALALLFIPLEHWFAQRPIKVFRKGFATDLGYYFLGGLTPKWLLLLPMAATTAVVHGLMPAAFHAWVAQWPTAMRFIVMVVVGDIGAYWGHRMMHEVPVLWRFHAVHHSSTEIDWLVNSRAHPVDLVLVRLAGLVPIHVLGLAQTPSGQLGPLLLTYLLVGTTWSFFVHANLRWRFGWLEQLIATPAFHHWHHTNDSAAVIDKNYAAIFPWLDRLFGTLYLPAGRWPERYGTDTPVAGTLGAQLVQPFTSDAGSPRPVR